MSAMDVSDSLSNALATKLALQMSVSALEVVEEWMDTPLTRWIDSVPLPVEMPRGVTPPLIVTVAADGRRMRWASGGVPEGIVPKLSDYLRKAGAVPLDFQLIDQGGQTIEPREVGSWIEIRPGVVESGWYFGDRMKMAAVADLLGEGAWIAELPAECLHVARSVGADPSVEVIIEATGDGRDERMAQLAAICTRLGMPIEERASAGVLSSELLLAVRARGGTIESVRVLDRNPASRAVFELASALGSPAVPALDQVVQSISASAPVAVGFERSAAGAMAEATYVAGTVRSSVN